jgi:hypothetical protein
MRGTVNHVFLTTPISSYFFIRKIIPKMIKNFPMVTINNIYGVIYVLCFTDCFSVKIKGQKCHCIFFSRLKCIVLKVKKWKKWLTSYLGRFACSLMQMQRNHSFSLCIFCVIYDAAVFTLNADLFSIVRSQLLVAMGGPF